MKALAIMFALVAFAAEAAERRYVTDEEAARWAGVGLLFWAGNGSCSAVLIRPDVALTAAHCVADADAKTVAKPGDLTFRAGQKDGRSLGSVRARRVDVHPGYFVAAKRYGKRRARVDIARVALETPVTNAPSYAVAPTPPAGAAVALVSYPGSRRKRASIQAPCGIVRRETEFLTLDCLSEPGASGAPYFAIGPSGEPKVIGINSGYWRQRGRSFAMALGFTHVRDFIGPSGGLRTPAEEAATGPRRRSGARLPGGSLAGEGLKRFRQ